MRRVAGGDLSGPIGPGPDPLPEEVTVVRRQPRPTPSATEIIRPPRAGIDPVWLITGALLIAASIIAVAAAVAAASLLPL